MRGCFPNAIVTFLIRASAIFIPIFPTVDLKDSWKPTPGVKNPVCTNTECVLRGQIYYNNMDTTVHPCDDFYKFACNKWVKNNPTPKHMWEWNTQTVIQQKLAEQLKDIAERREKPNDDTKVLQLRKVYKACMNTPTLSKGNPKFVWQRMKAAGVDGLAPWWEIHENYLKLTGESALMDITVVGNSERNYNPILEFKELETPYGSFFHYVNWNPMETDIYISLLELLYSTRASNASPVKKNLFMMDIMEVVLFKHRLNELSRDCMRLKDGRFTPITVKAFQEWYNNVRGQKPSAQINWRQIVRIMLKDVPDEVIDSEEMIVVRRKEYFQKLNEVLATTPEEIIVTHLHLYFLERYLKFDSEAKELQRELFAVKNTINAYKRYDREKWLACLEDMQMDVLQGKLYIDTYFDKHLKQKVTALIEDLKNAIADEISQSTWMDRETKEKSISRMKSVTMWIGYPEWYDNSQMEIAAEDVMHPTKPNAFFCLGKNRVEVNAAMLVSPVYAATMPPVVNYGSAGYFLAHELHHMFDGCGFPCHGQKNPVPWWPWDMHIKCEKRKECFIKQYNQYIIPELVGYTKNFQVNGDRTSEENIADVMGLKAAYYLHAKKVKENKGKCEVLPKFEKFSCDQMFFLAYANTLCGEKHPTIVRMKYKSMRHSPRNLRINGALRNLDAFARAFECTTEMGIRARETCDMWK